MSWAPLSAGGEGVWNYPETVHLVPDENVRGRTALADELRGEFRLLARTVASASRGAVHPPGES